jgi:CrcB protein
MMALVALGGALGTVLRWMLSLWFPTPPGGIPWSTLGINVAGSFILGLLARYFMTHSVSPAVVAALTVGLCGGFTTFSAFSGDTLRLIQGGQWGKAGIYVLGSVMLSLVAVGLGDWVGRAVRGAAPG